MDDGGAFKDVGAFIEFGSLIGVLFEDIRFFDDWYRFACEGTLVDEGGAFEYDGFEGEFDGVFEENDVPGDDINR